jgi:uncharacterized membrane protein
LRDDARVSANVQTPPRPPEPARDDPFVQGASRLVGGLRGRHASGRLVSWWTPLRAMLVLTVLTATLGFLAKSPCRTHPWGSEFQYTRVCYTDVFALYYSESLGTRTGPDGVANGRLSVPYRDHPVEYPAVIGGLMWTAAEITNLVHPHDPTSTGVDHRARTFFDVTVLMLALCALLTTWAVARLAGRQRVWDAAMFALAPTLLLHAYTNWDLAAVALAMLGMWAWSRGSPVLAGAALGLGIATKLYPVLILLALLFLCWRSARLRGWLVCAATAAAAFVFAYLPVWMLSSRTPGYLRTSAFLFPSRAPGCTTGHYLPGWRWFWTLNSTRGADWDSLWFQLQHARGQPLDGVQACGATPFWLNTGVAIATLAVIGGVSLLVLAAPRRPRLPQVTFLLVAGFLLVNKVDSPQYVLWLVPLAVLARPRWPAFLAWQAAEAALLFARFYYFVGTDHPGQGVPTAVFFTAVWVRDLALLAVVGLVVREVLQPRYDVVRHDGVDDPAGGVLDHAPDRWAGAGATVRRPAPA